MQNKLSLSIIGALIIFGIKLIVKQPNLGFFAPTIGGGLTLVDIINIWSIDKK